MALPVMQAVVLWKIPPLELILCSIGGSEKGFAFRATGNVVVKLWACLISKCGGSVSISTNRNRYPAFYLLGVATSFVQHLQLTSPPPTVRVGF